MKIISVHTPKAGGSSVSKILQNAFGEAFLGDYNDDPTDPLSERNIDPERFFARKRQFPAGIQCIHGHFHPGQFDTDGAFLFTLLRHPVDNMISIYSFWKSWPGTRTALHSYVIENDLNVLEAARLPLLRWLYSQSYFGSFDMSRFDLIGRHEDRAAALARLSAQTGIPADAATYENVTPPSAEREAIYADSALMERLEDLLADDIRFYERHAA
jgi:hypothetical protein